MTVAVITVSFQKIKPKYLNWYLKCQFFLNEKYMNLFPELSNENFNANTIEKLLGICINSLNQRL